MPLIPFGDKVPKIADDVFIADGAQVIGDVTIGEGSSVWYNVVIRGDIEPVVIGKNTNIQDNATIHVETGLGTTLGDNVSVGHNAVVHGCTIGDGALIAIHSVVLSGATIGAGSLVGAGAIVGEKKEVPPRTLVLGVPAKVVRELSDQDLERMARTARNYVALARKHKSRERS